MTAVGRSRSVSANGLMRSCPVRARLTTRPGERWRCDAVSERVVEDGKVVALARIAGRAGSRDRCDHRRELVSCRATDGPRVLGLLGAGPKVSKAVFSPDGKRIVTGSEDQTARCGTRRAGAVAHAHGAHRRCVRAWPSARTGSGSSAAASDGTLKVWDATSGRKPLTLKGHTGWRLRAWPSARTGSGSSAAARTDAEGVGRDERPQPAHAQGAHRRVSRAWPSARTGSGSSGAAATGR